MPIDQETFDQLKALWITVGGNPGSADLAAAVAFAESSGCQYALAGPVDIRPVQECHWTVTNGENSCGYWQINLRAHPQYHAPEIFDAYTNARAAVSISSDGSDWNAWSTYKDGAYRPFLDAYAGHAATTPPPPPTGDPAVDPSNLDSLNGWRHFTLALGRGLPRQLAASQHYRGATLRLLRSKGKVPR